jgi:hypothetical protein
VDRADRWAWPDRGEFLEQGHKVGRLAMGAGVGGAVLSQPGGARTADMLHALTVPSVDFTGK